MGTSESFTCHSRYRGKRMALNSWEDAECVAVAHAVRVITDAGEI